METSEILHQKFNPRSDQIPPIRIKGFTRAKLAELFAELGFTKGAEIGVAEGHYSLVLCQTIPNLKLSCVDLWDTYYRGTTKLKDKIMQDWALEQAHEKLDKYNPKFIRKSSMDAVKDFEDNSLDFVYIDGDHSFDFVMQDIIEWSKKVKPGGIVSLHDYYRFRGAGVVNAVDAYIAAHQIHEWFLDDQRETGVFWVKS
jgi:predicted O-methyltransferase YrrM